MATQSSTTKSTAAADHGWFGTETVKTRTREISTSKAAIRLERRRDATAGGAGFQSRGRSLPRADARRLLVSRVERDEGCWSEDTESGRVVGEPDGRRDAPPHRQHRNRLRAVRDRPEARRPGRDRSAGQSARRPVRSVAARDHGDRPNRRATRARAASSCFCPRITTAPRPTATWLPSRKLTAWCLACAAFSRRTAQRQQSR